MINVKRTGRGQLLQLQMTVGDILPEKSLILNFLKNILTHCSRHVLKIYICSLQWLYMIRISIDTNDKHEPNWAQASVINPHDYQGHFT